MLDRRSSDWDNEWQEIPGPEAIMIGVVQNPELLPLQGKTLTEVAAAMEQRSYGRAVRLADRGRAPSQTVAVFGMSEPDVRWPCSSRGSRSTTIRQGTSPDGLLGKEHPHPRAYGTFPRILRKYVREEKKLTLEDAIRKFSALARAADAPDRSRSAESRHVGGCRGLRSGHDPRPGDFRKPEPALAGHGLRAGQRRAGHRAGQDDRNTAGKGAARSRIHASMTDQSSSKALLIASSIRESIASDKRPSGGYRMRLFSRVVT